VLLVAAATSHARPKRSGGVVDAAATFGQSTVLASSAAGPGGVAAAIDATGNSVVAYTTATALLVRRGSPDGRFGAPEEVVSGALETPLLQASIAPDGTLAVAWQKLSDKRPFAVAIASPGGGFGAPQLLPTGSLEMIATAGRVVAVWNRGVSKSRGELEYAIAGAGHRFGSVHTVVAANKLLYPNLEPGIRLAADANGDVVAAYQTATGTTAAENPHIAADVLGAGASTFAPPVMVSTSPADSASITSGPGGLAITYTQSTSIGPGIDFAALAPDGAFAAPQRAGTVSWPNPGSSELDSVGPVAGVPSTGGAVVAWTRLILPDGAPPPRSGQLYATAESANSTFAPATQLEAPNTVPNSPLAAATADTGIVVWGQLLDPVDGNYAAESIDYALHTGAGFTPRRLLATNPLPQQGYSPDTIALAAAGAHAIIAWSQWEPQHTVSAVLLNGG